MINDLIDEFFCALLLGAIHEAQTVTIVWDGGPARMIVRMTNGAVMATAIHDGQPLTFDRDARVIFEPAGSSWMRHPLVIVNAWAVN